MTHPAHPTSGPSNRSKRSLAESLAILRSPLILSLALAAVTFVVFYPVLRHQFLLYDDPEYVTANPHVSHGLTPQAFCWAFVTGHMGNWHPVTWLSHMMDVQMFGLHPAGHHLLNLLLHVANTVLLFLLLRRITGAVWQSAMVAAMFAWHPLHVESVAWIAERKDVLSTFFELLSIHAYVRYAERSRPRTAKGLLWLSLALFLFALGLMSKAMVATLPFLLLLLDYWPLRRGRLATLILDRPMPADGLTSHTASGPSRCTLDAPSSPLSLKRLLLEKIPFFALSAVATIVAGIALKDARALGPAAPLGERLAGVCVAYLRYLAKSFWPVDLVTPYPPAPAPPTGLVAGAAAIILGLSLSALFLARRRPYVFTGLFWFLGVLVPVVGLVQLGAHSIADRYTYFPLIGLAITLVWGVSDLGQRWPTMRVARTVTASLVLAVFAVATRTQVDYWQDSQSLFEHAVAASQNNVVAYSNLGTLFLRQGDWAKAEQNYAAALRSGKDLFEARLNWALVLAHQGQTERAVRELRGDPRSETSPQLHLTLANILAECQSNSAAAQEYAQALRLRPDYFEAHNSFGALLAKQGNLEGAIIEFQAALAVNPDDPDAHFNLANVLSQAGRFAEAASHFTETVNSNPRDAIARLNLGKMLVLDGKPVEGAAQLEEALRLEPQPEAHYFVALAFHSQSRFEEALPHYREAVRLGRSPLYLNDLAWLLATCPRAQVRDGKEAVRLAEEACRLTDSKVPQFLGTLDAAYAECGRFDDALATATKTRDLAILAHQPDIAQAATERLALYRNSRPYRSAITPSN